MEVYNQPYSEIMGMPMSRRIRIILAGIEARKKENEDARAEMNKNRSRKR